MGSFRYHHDFYQTYPLQPYLHARPSTPPCLRPLHTDPRAFALTGTNHAVNNDDQSKHCDPAELDEMTTTNQGDKSFFELLPPEIRDQIYDSTMFQDIQREQFNFRFRAPCPHLRLVSRQFKDEYDRQSIWGTALEVSFPADLAKDMWHIHTPVLAARCTSLQLNYLFQKDPHTREISPGAFAITCCRIMLHLFPESLQHLDVHLVWKSVRMLKDYASQRRIQLHYCLNYIVKNQYRLRNGATRHDMQEDNSDYVILPGLKLQYGGISPSNTSMRLECDVLGAGLLKKPATLGTWSVNDCCFLLDDDGVNERLRMETLVEAASAVTVKDEPSRNAEFDAPDDQIWHQEVKVEQN